jgi:hypothetical protein
VTQAGVTTSNTRISENQGFDILLAPSQSEMDAWLSSPYRDIGVYIGGCDASVAPPSGMKDGCGNVPAQVSARAKNSNLDSGWVSHVSNNGNGWGIMPLWVGPQSSCITSNPSDHNLIENAIQTTASALGTSEADEAASRASELGMGNSIVYYDMEAYITGNSSCSGNVGQFLSGWVNELHLKGFLAGVYVAASNVADFITPPDAIWVFRPNGNNVASDLGIAGSSNWTGKRIHQYCAGGSAQICPSPASQTYGGVTLGTYPNQGIDLDVEDGPVFSLSATGSAPTISNVAPPSMTASTTALTTVTVTGTNFSTSGGYLHFTDPNNATYDSTAHPERVVSVTATQWQYQLNNGGTAGTWHVTVVNSDGQTSNSGSFTVSGSAPTISNVAPPSMAASTTALTTVTVTGTNFSTSGGYLHFTDPNNATYDSTAHPERVVSVTATQWQYQLNNGATKGTWHVTVVNSDSQTSNSGSFTVQ